MKMIIEPLKKEEVGSAAHLAADFRVKLNGFRGVMTEPDLSAGAEELSEYLDKGCPVFIAKEGDRPCGIVVCRIDEPCVWTEMLYVSPEYRRRGIASALFHKAEELAEARGETTVFNFIHPNNEAIIAFLKSKGYSVLNLIEIRKPYAGETVTGKMRVGDNEFDY